MKDARGARPASSSGRAEGAPSERSAEGISPAHRGRRLCLLIGAYYPVVGGGETQMKLLAESLARRGWAVQVVTQRRPAEASPFDRVEGIPVHRVWPRGKDRAGKYLMMAPAFGKLLATRSRYDVILVSGIRTLGVIGVLAGKLCGKRSVLRMASCEEMRGGYIGSGSSPSRRLGRPLLALRNAVLRRADAYVAVSRAVHDEYVECGVDAKKISLVPNGTDVEAFRPPTDEERRGRRRELGLPLEERIVVYTGKLNRGKGLARLLRVWLRLSAERERLHLVLVGGGGNQSLSCEPELRQFVRDHGLEDSVTFTGYTRDVVAYLQAADLFVLPSDSEAMPNALIEAMATGLPCVASAVGGVLDILEDGRNGRTVPPGDDDALLVALRSLLDDATGARELGRRAREDAVSKYARETNVERIVGVLSRAFAGDEARRLPDENPSMAPRKSRRAR